MNETNGKYTMKENQPARTMGINGRSYLNGKVALLVGSDTAVLHSLVTQLAQRGADIALVCRNWSGDGLNRLKEKVEALGHHLLLLNEPGEEGLTAPQIIGRVIESLGRLDIFIDLSVKQKEGGENGSAPTYTPVNWLLMKTAVQEMV
jgi:hypothetical protein